MSRLWFISPAWQRFEIVSVCLEQRNRVIAELAKHGIEAHQVVVADDENLDIARSLGAAVVECPNFGPDGQTILGRRWNVGMQYAAKQGADWFVQIGSDSWVDPAYFVPLTGPRYTLTSPAYCAVTLQKMAQLSVSPRNLRHSAGPYVFHRSLLVRSDFAPCEETSRMTDTSTIAGIERTARTHIRWSPRTLHQFQYVGFRVEPLMTTYGMLVQRWLVRESESWGLLAQHYPNDLVIAARRAMEA